MIPKKKARWLLPKSRGCAAGCGPGISLYGTPLCGPSGRQVAGPERLFREGRGACADGPTGRNADGMWPAVLSVVAAQASGAAQGVSADAAACCRNTGATGAEEAVRVPAGCMQQAAVDLAAC